MSNQKTNQRAMEDEVKSSPLSLVELREMGCKRYGIISRRKKILGAGLILCSFVLPDLGAGLLLGLVVLGYNPKVILKSRSNSISEWTRLRF